MLDGGDFGNIEVTGDEIVQHAQLRLIQIILGNAHVPFHGHIAGEGAQPMKGWSASAR